MFTAFFNIFTINKIWCDRNPSWVIFIPNWSFISWKVNNYNFWHLWWFRIGFITRFHIPRRFRSLVYLWGRVYHLCCCFCQRDLVSITDSDLLLIFSRTKKIVGEESMIETSLYELAVSDVQIEIHCHSLTGEQTVKTVQKKYYIFDFIMPHWNCSSSLCFNTFCSKLKCYRLPRKPNIQLKYKRLFKTEGWNWKAGYICCEHWENNKRNSSSDLPTVIFPPSQLVKLKELIQDAKNNHTKNPSSSDKIELTVLKNKLVAAERIICEGKGSLSSKPKRRIITKIYMIIT
eukprot:TCONS_00043427-protein